MPCLVGWLALPYAPLNSCGHREEKAGGLLVSTGEVGIVKLMEAW